MLIYVKKKKKTFYGQTDGRTDGQPKTIVRNLSTCTQKKNSLLDKQLKKPKDYSTKMKKV